MGDNMKAAFVPQAIIFDLDGTLFQTETLLETVHRRVFETLRELRERGIRLFIASNGLEAYVKGVPNVKGIGDWFEGKYSAGEFSTTTKVDLVRRLLDTFGVETAWMVGDRSSDVEAGKSNGLFVVGCDYAGFGREGELDGSAAVIRSFPDLLKLLP